MNVTLILFESGEWAGEEVLTVPLKLQLDGNRQTGAKAGTRGVKLVYKFSERPVNEIYSII